MAQVVLAATGGQAQFLPVGRPVTGPRVALGIDKGLQIMHRMAIERLPVGANPARDSAQEVRGQMRDTHPRQDQEAALVGDLVHMRPAHGRRPADEAVTRSEVTGRRGEAQTGEWPPLAKSQVLELLADTLHRAEVMRLGDQVIEESFQWRAADRHQFDGAQGAKRLFQRRAVHCHRRRPAADNGVVRWAVADFWQADVLGPVQGEQQAAADHVAQRAIGLTPVPVFAQALREGPAAGVGMRFEQRADGFEVAGSDRATAVGKDRGHADRYAGSGRGT